MLICRYAFITYKSSGAIAMEATATHARIICRHKRRPHLGRFVQSGVDIL